MMMLLSIENFLLAIVIDTVFPVIREYITTTIANGSITTIKGKEDPKEELKKPKNACTTHLQKILRYL